MILRRLLTLAALCLVTWVLTVSGDVFAAGLSTDVTADVVAVGEQFEVQLSVTLEDDTKPSEPRISVSGPGQIVQGPSMGTTRSITMHNFNFSSQTKLVVSWTLVATAKGRITIGPGSLKLGGQRLTGEQVTVSVVDEPQRRSRGRDPFDDFFSRDPFGMLRQRQMAPEMPEAPPELVPPSAPDQIGFLYAQLSKSNVLVGEPVILNIYAFGGQGPFDEANPVEPSLADFLIFREVQTSYDEPKYRAVIAEQPFQVTKLREMILVPLKAGHLEIGSMQAILHGRGYPERGTPLGYPVRSQKLRLHVSEAPKAGRPADFVEGDVGRFGMEAELYPTELTEGEYAELLVHVSGEGNLPTRVPLPEGAAWEWQKPSTVGEPEVRDRKLQGRRTIKVPLRALTPGEVQLGRVSFPYFDLENREYLRLEATLPTLKVRARAKPEPAPEPSEPQVTAAQGQKVNLEPLVVPRKTLSHFESRGQLGRGIWPAALGVPPLAMGLYGAVLGAVRISQRRRRRLSPEVESQKAAQKALGELSAAEKKGTSEVALVRRTMELVLTSGLGKTGRGLTAEELETALQKVGINPERAKSLTELRSALDQLDFAGTTAASVPQSASLLRDLLATFKRGGRGAESA